MIRLVLLVAAFIVLAVAPSGARDARGVALVVGNAAYRHVSPLRNPKNDAEAVAATLERLGLTVFTGVDVTRLQFEELVRDFSREARDAPVAIFFYAGHGLQVEGRNYLVPVDAEIADETDLEFETLRLDSVLTPMERESRTNLVFLDACRDNPLARNLARSMGTRSTAVGSGLARIESGVGTMISFATQPGNVALDGEGRHSPFTQALLEHVETPGLDVELMMRRVRRDVMAATNERQVPWSNSSLTGSFVFKEIEAPPPTVSAPSPDVPNACELLVKPDATRDTVLLSDLQAAVEACTLAAARDPENRTYPALLAAAQEQQAARTALVSTNPVYGEAYQRLYPGGRFAEDVRRHLAALTPVQVPSAAADGMAASRSEAPADALPTMPAARDTASGEQEPRPTVEPIVTAALTPDAITAPAVEEPADRLDLVGPELARRLQSELNRVGCDVGTVDGVWGARSRSALKLLGEHTEALQVATLEPSVDLLRGLEALEGRICPLACAATDVLQDGACVRKTCPAGQSLSSKGVCYTPRKATSRASGGGSRGSSGGCFTFNGQRYCN